MKIGFYPKLAASGIQKNKRMYVPYILTCIGIIMMFYIIMFLAANDTISKLTGGQTIRQMFGLGSWVITVFAGIFLFYTNSFLIRRRKKEFGLYNILGMGKQNIGRILFWETGMIALLSEGIGLFAGILFSKLAELGLVNVMHGDVAYNFSVSILAIIRTLQVFGVIFVLLFLNSIRQVRFTSAINLMHSENVGEKPPKYNWLIGIAGIFILGAAYYLSATIQDPVAALMTFFSAVIMVIIGTYLTMITGSVLFCRILQKKKSYYYKSNHFVSVSSMVYRMKRNGAGLASICILATMVLVMMASTTCLYFGEENAINTRYPRDINLEFRVNEISALSDQKIQILRDGVSEELKAHRTLPENDYFYRSAAIYGMLEGNTVEANAENISAMDAAFSAYQICFIPLEDYNEVMGTNETLNEGEALLYAYRTDYNSSSISFKEGESFQIKKQIDAFTSSGDTAMDLLSSLLLVVPDFEKSISRLAALTSSNGDPLLHMKCIYNFDTGMEPKQQITLYHNLTDTLTNPSVKENLGYTTVYASSQAYERDDFFSLFGALFYIGIMLSIVFIFAAVLIIYYKQISEGYEDQSRFEIMQKVGMTKREIRKSINSQLLTIFFLPLIFAAMHLCFSFPIICKLLLLFNLNNVRLFAATTAVSFSVFALFYMIVYRITSNAYYNIVSGAKETG